ncbi:bifunctional 2-keto-4-hydroxyglutarate aldolase/2-keto-3-deoxy-6-phosphogluconate aldolase [Lapidilactobacillus luobeiensis]|uniref:bifunctional 2-keto-4-hydroxyglutarate aldolase/2-keto-3-deoxy-6-phosphogluconate aldolase n=1 Tax=Lapidilactobacillus luobeiensis TaxID=2950371 RepID=UPI0021C4026D|nr:bifunctional 2-keto-4-hydroxyglutarate aldolase/2-keto-3-deoxy-6-phosphogluconate aldolase [Lapidilactobacillus luobeiensis]
MTKGAILKQLGESGIVAVIRASTVERSVEVAEACVAGGVKGIELTFTVPNAGQAIAKLVEEYADRPDVLIGAGTVLSDYDAHEAIKAGASFIVSATFSESVAAVCNASGINYVPGCFTPTEVYHAKTFGSDLIKVFPAGLVGPAVVKDFHGPFPDTDFMTTGGVSLDNLTDWFDAGVFAVGVGGSLVGNDQTDLTTIQSNAAKFTAKYQAWRAK